MDPTQIINQRVEVAVFYRKDCDVSMLAYPVKMKYKNQEIKFTRLGLRHETAKGKRMIHVFDVTDDVNDYRLEFDAQGLTWTLVSMIPGVNL
jgi:hypothetical protein